ncbi:hypothetical protein IC229_11150 [Spirosoma sp. BT702]|uniref:DUF3568 family protein n=1 Tax=Spirosoma profusum TaxID=2771354 RepID=A0A926Y2S2_9BACT|nr:hypothetical protein [Spirosoma profusum]MBD2701195.1 hypothetical protein [Spirosoma profusum]
MKQIITMLLLSATVLACSDGDLKIAVTDSDDTYEFSAKYDKKKTQRVQDFINQKMAPGSNVTGDHVDITTTLDDNTRFELEEYPGKVRIKLDKEDNTEASYRRVKAMCEGVKRIVGGK